MKTAQPRSKDRAGRPAISLILAVYNQRRLAPIVLSSISAQVIGAPFEVLICDDGSSDEILHSIAGWASEAPALDVRYIWQPNLGFRKSRSVNNGIRNAQGEILVFADGDGWLSPFFLQDHWTAQQTPGRLVCGFRQELILDRELLPESDTELLKRVLAEKCNDPEERTELLRSDRPWMACTGCNFSVNKSDVLMYDEEFEGWGSEDRDLAYRLYTSGLNIHLFPRPNMVHLKGRNTAAEWNPIQGGGHDAIVAALQSKLALRRKYPDDTMMPSLSLVKHCYLNAATDKWALGPARAAVSEDEILNEFAAWRARR